MWRAVALAVCAVPAVAQDVPVFDPNANFVVEQILDEQALVMNRQNPFLCDLLPGDGVIQLQDCKPIILGRLNSAAVAQAARVVELMPPPAFQAAILSVMNDLDCVIDINRGEAAIRDDIIARMAEKLGFAPEVRAAVEEALDQRISDTLDEMNDRFVIDRNAATVTLVDGCES